MIGLIAMMTALPVLWMEPADPGRVVTRDDAVGMCATSDRDAVAEMDAMIADARPGRCADLSGTWKVTRRITDRCIGREPGWYMDRAGRRHPAVSCRVEAHVVEIAQDGGSRLALIMTTEEGYE